MILLISSTFPPEPVVSSYLAYELALELSKNNRVAVLTPRPSRPMGFHFKELEELDTRFRHIIVNSYIYPKSDLFGRLRESYSFGIHARKFINRECSVIDCIYINTWPLFSQFIITKTARRHSIPTILHIQDIYPESLINKLLFFKRFVIKLIFPIDRYIHRNSSQIVTISPGLRSYLIETRGLTEEKVNIVYNWQNEEIFLSFRNLGKAESGRSKFTFMFLGNLNMTASVDTLISAFKEIKSNDTRLVIAGNGPEKESLLAMVNNIKDNRIEFLDARTDQVPEIQSKADILLLNLKKGAAKFALPSKLIAYMLSAKPIIACVDEDSDTSYIIQTAGCGWVINSGDISELKNKLIEVKSLPKDQLMKIGLNGFNYAITNFSKEKNLKKLAQIILDY